MNWVPSYKSWLKIPSLILYEIFATRIGLILYEIFATRIGPAAKNLQKASEQSFLYKMRIFHMIGGIRDNLNDLLQGVPFSTYINVEIVDHFLNKAFKRR